MNPLVNGYGMVQRLLADKFMPLNQAEVYYQSNFIFDTTGKLYVCSSDSWMG